MEALDIRPLGDHIGACIADLPLGAAVSDDQLVVILDALATYKVLVFPRQSLDAASFHDFACRFGSLQHHVLRKYRHEQFPGLSWLTNVSADGSVDAFGITRATTWHSDGSYTQAPPALGILYALEVPSRGGATLFADMCHAYAQLDEATRAQVRGLTGLHCHGAGPGGDMYDSSLDDDQEEGFKDAVHPAVSVHPRSGEPLLYVNSTHTRKFAELDQRSSVALLNSLVETATQPDNVYVHDWSVGDLLMWDQRGTIHRGAGDYPPTDRRIKLRAIVQELRL
jgi:alpha-ketoglutarate-dependent taurine dioxygenase